MPTMASANRHVLKEPRKTFHALADLLIYIKHVSVQACFYLDFCLF